MTNPKFIHGIRIFNTLAAGVIFGLLIGSYYSKPVVKPNPLPSVYEIQEQLRNQGYYEGKIDGRIGKDTIQAWDRAICDREASKWR